MKLKKRDRRRAFRLALLTKVISLAVMLPHIMFHHVYEHHRQDFNQMFLGTNDPAALPTVLPVFWQELARRRDPGLQHHPMFGTANWHTPAIPISLYGDAAPGIRCPRAGSESFGTYSWMSILGKGTTLYLKQYLFGLFNTMKTADTMTPAWEEICWSLEALEEGVWPRGPSEGGTCASTSAEGVLAGTALAGGFFCILYLLIGDSPHFAECFGLRRHNAYNPCDFCPVHNQVGGDPRYYRFNFASRATWKTSLYTAADWRNLYSALHVLFRRFLYLSQYNVAQDELHVMHLGVGQELLGSVLWYLVFIMMAGDAMSNMHAVWADVVDIYIREGIKTRFNTVSISSFTGGKSPQSGYFARLKGKKAEVKHLLFPLLEVFRKHIRPTDATGMDNLILECLETYGNIVESFDGWRDGLFLPPTLPAKSCCGVTSFVISIFLWPSWRTR